MPATIFVSRILASARSPGPARREPKTTRAAAATDSDSDFVVGAAGGGAGGGGLGGTALAGVKGLSRSTVCVAQGQEVSKVGEEGQISRRGKRECWRRTLVIA